METKEFYCDIIIVSRHQNAVEFIADRLYQAIRKNRAVLGAKPYCTDYIIEQGKGVTLLTERGGDEILFIPIFSGDVTPDDVRGKIVFGNLPLKLAALTASYYAVESIDDSRCSDSTTKFLLCNYRVHRQNGVCAFCFGAEFVPEEEGGRCIYCGQYWD